MKLQRFTTLLVAMAVSAAGQVPPKSASVPRMADGHPDLQGIWTNATMTPLQRPAELGSKEFFTEQEAADFVKKRQEQQSFADRPESRKQGDPGAYNQAFFDFGNRIVKTRRTSL